MLKKQKMKIGILGTGMVGNSIGTKLVQLGHQVMMGSRTAKNEKALAWVSAAGNGASAGTFADAASYGEMLFNCTAGIASLAALEMAGKENMKGKVLVDVGNTLDFSKGMPPTLTVCNTDSLGEQIQRAFPETKVVKSLNTMNCMLMVNPASLPGEHCVFVCGNDADAKTKVTDLLKTFGWKNLIDLGDISGSRGTDMMMPIWIRMYGAFQSVNFNYSIIRG